MDKAIPQALIDDATKLRELWERKPSPTLFETALRLDLEYRMAEILVVMVTALEWVKWCTDPASGRFTAEFT